MSGGHLDYFYCILQEHEHDFGDKELDGLVHDLAELFHDREWYLSGDTGEGDWAEARDAFKDRWFTPHGRQERIEEYIEEFSREIRETFGMAKTICEVQYVKGCRNCRHGKYNDFWKTHFCYCPNDCKNWDKWEPSETDRKPGKWLTKNDDSKAVCSQCDYPIYGTPYNGKYYIVHYNFCPNCGADMRGGKNENT